MKVVKVQANARLSCPMDVEVVQEKDQVATECLQDVLRDSCFHLEELEILQPDCGSARVRMVGFITLVSDSYSESAKREFEEIVRHATEKAEWKLEKCPLIEQI
jgi:hypothetical protein